MYRRIIDLLLKYKEAILYLIFGVGTTLVNIVVYYIFEEILQISYLISNGLAWFFSVLFAFVTNKKFVFEKNVVNTDLECSFYVDIETKQENYIDFHDKYIQNKNINNLYKNQISNKQEIYVQLKNFFIARVATGILDMFFMWFLISIVMMQEMLAKIIVNIVVIVLNYVISKFWVFARKNQ
ncbi:MAG: GtrA family protein [Lachnospiraceae bacterium]|nr:GtrA family protein [Lachnospiraceae bacterium]